jgi:flotillin
MSRDIVASDEKSREAIGWRSGKPVEDPDKMKRWGFISAKPSEHLIHVRRGRITHRSGQGASCFKWPWDAVALVPTSLQRLSFRADQVTAEKVGVEVAGFAVYRIAEPLIAFRMLNFSYPESAQEKLEHTLTAMFVGATRRIVATLSVEDCLRRRKAALATELLAEIAPVVGGSGKSDDDTDRGWGVVIDTIEIQEVRVLSKSVFAAMQAPYRAELERAAREAKASADRAISESETALAARRAELEEGLARRRGELDAALVQRQGELAAERAQAEANAAMRDAALEAEKAAAITAAHAVRLEAEEKLAELERLRGALQADLARLHGAAQRDTGLAEAEVALRRAEAHARHSEAEARLELARKLPLLAEAYGKRIGEVKITSLGGGESPFAQLASGLTALVDLVQRA